MQALTHCNATFMSTRTAAGQFKGQFKGAMDDSSRNVQNANAHLTLCKQGSIQSVQWGTGRKVQVRAEGEHTPEA